MQKMKEAFERKISALNETLQRTNCESAHKIVTKEKELLELRRGNEQLYRRLQLFAKYIVPE